MHLAIAMGDFNLKRFEQSLPAFDQAEDVSE